MRFFRFIQFKFFNTELYRNIMVWYYKQYSEKLKDFEELLDVNEGFSPEEMKEFKELLNINESYYNG